MKQAVIRSDDAVFPDLQPGQQTEGRLPVLPHRRSRRWENRHRHEKAVYRGLDPQLVREVQRLASSLAVPQGEVARFILEYALRQYEEGFLNLVSRPNPMRTRMTLYPISRKASMNRRLKTSARAEPSWRHITTWRNFSPELKRVITALASREALNVPTGELVNALLHYGLQAHRAGLLKLEPAEEAIVMTLAGGDET